MTDTLQLTPEQLEVIRERAYQRFIERGGEDGHDLEDWLAAEQELLTNSADRPAEKATKSRKAKAAA